MYAWKWWREHRGRAITYLIILSAFAAFIPWLNPAGPPHFAGQGYVPGAVETWRIALVVFGSIVLVIAGLGLGASGVGDEFSQGTLGFLLAQPRSRKYFVWAGWLAGASAVLMIIGLAVLISLASLAVLTKTALGWKLPTIIVPLFVLGAVVYGLTFFMTALTKNGRNGMSYSLGVLAISLPLPWALETEAKVSVPSPFDVLEASKWATSQSAHFPFVAIIGWGLVALAFPLATQFLFERAEV